MEWNTDPATGARKAADALREVARISNYLDRLDDMRAVMGDLLSNLRSLDHILDRLATSHEQDGGRAFDQHGDQHAGHTDAQRAAIELRQAATLIGQAEDRLSAAHAAAGRITWHPAPAPDPQGRYVCIAFLQGSEADELIGLTSQGGTVAAIQQLASYDFGDETVDAALENGYVYDEPPTSQLDLTARLDAYTMVYNPLVGYVGLYRREHALPSPTLLGLEPRHTAPPPTIGARSRTTIPLRPASEEALRRQLGDPDLSALDVDATGTARGIGR